MDIHILVYWLILTVYDDFVEGNTENFSNPFSWQRNVAFSELPATNVENQTQPSNYINLNISITVDSSNTSGHQDMINIALISTINNTFDELIKNAFLNLKLSNDIPHGDLQKVYRPWYAGSGTTLPPRVKPGKPWPARPQDYPHFGFSVNRNEETTDNIETSSLSDRLVTLVSSSGNTQHEQIEDTILEEDFISSTNKNLETEDRFQTISTVGLSSNAIITNHPTLQPGMNRPFFAGLGTTRPPKIKPGKPWPARPEDYANFSATTGKSHEIVDRFQEDTIQNINTTSPKPIPNNLTSSMLLPASDRPFFAGLGTTRPPKIKPGKPWPARPEDYANFSATTDKSHEIVDRFQETTIQNINTTSPKPIPNNLTSSVLLPASDRPFFAGLGTTRPPKIKPGKPWPARPEDYANFSTTTDKSHEIVDRFQETTIQNINATSPKPIPNNLTSSMLLPASDRPFFAGLGTTRPPKIKPGKPWPARPEDYANSSTTTDKSQEIVDRFQETTIQNINATSPKPIPNNLTSSMLLPASDRPFFAGLGTTRPPKIKPGKPWPARPEDYANFSATTDKSHEIVDRFQETTIQNINTTSPKPIPNNLTSSMLLPASDRPFFAGLGTTRPPKIKPGKPWPARPEEYANFSATTDKSHEIVDRFQETTIQNINTTSPKPIPNNLTSSVLLPASDRPFFAGLGTTKPPKIKPGKPWPARPEDYANFSTTTDKSHEIVDRFQETTIQNINATSPKPIPNNLTSSMLLPASDRPFFAGLGTTRPPKIKPGKPWPTRPEDYANFSTTTDKSHEIVDRFQETTIQNINTTSPKPIPNNLTSSMLLPASDRPFFAGLGTTRPPKIKPGKPWPARPEDYANFSTTTDKSHEIVDRFQGTTIQNINATSPKPIPNNLTSSMLLPASDRPFFAGLGTKIKPGKPWPARPEDYANFSATTDKSQEIVDRFIEDTIQNINTSSPKPIPNNLTSSILLPAPETTSIADLGTTRLPNMNQKKPWTAIQGGSLNFSATTDRIQNIVDRFQEATTQYLNTASTNENSNNNNPASGM